MDEDRVLHLLCGPIQTNCYVYVSDGHAMVVDPAGSGARVAEVVEGEGASVDVVVATHGHGDHVGGVAALVRATGAPFRLSAADAALATRCAHDPEIPLPVDDDAPAPDAGLAEGDVVEVGSARFRVLETPGHTPGGVCLVGEGTAEGVCFVGDTLFQGSAGRTDLPGGDAAALVASLARLADELPDDCRVLPGHGPASTMGEERRSNPFLGPHASAYLGL